MDTLRTSESDYPKKITKTEYSVSTINVRESKNRFQKLFLGIFLIGFLFFTSIIVDGLIFPKNDFTTDRVPGKISIDIYSSPYCGCCHQYVKYLEESSFEVNHTKSENYSVIKDELEIPEELRSCHTMLLGDYVIEGHVPIEAIFKLLDETPSIDGISLPGMPEGAPGMSGDKEDTFHIIAFSNGEVTGIFVSI
jgi:hypothetical protein